MSERQKFAYFKQVGIGLGAGFAVVGLVIGGSIIAGTPKNQGAAKPSQSASATQSATPTPEPTSTLAACSVSKAASDKKLATLQALVVDANTMRVLYNLDEARASATASTMKLLTSTVAIQQLGADYRATTRVYQDSADAGIIYLVGGGDPTLSRTAKGKSSVYKKAPKISDLADQIKAAVGDTPITKIVADGSLFSGSEYLKSWETSERKIGYMSQVSALQADGDRKNPAKETSPRSTTPELNTGKYLRDALGSVAENATVETGVTPTTATQIASVQSQPISNWIEHMLTVSDNTQAEALARLIAIDQNKTGSFDSIDSAYKSVLGGLGLDVSGIKVMDGSGLSDFNAVSPQFMISLMKLLVDSKTDLKLIRKDLTVSGETGSLAWRFNKKNKDAKGHVYAKTGWIKHGYTLVGYINAKDKSKLLFAVYALGKVTGDTPTAIDTLVTGFYRCGLALSNG